MKRVVIGRHRPLPKEVLSKAIRSKARKKLLNQILKLYLQLIEESLTQLILSTPVDTGTARLNWYVSTVKREPMGGFLPNPVGETGPRKRAHDVGAPARADYPLQFGMQSSRTMIHIQNEMSKIEPELREQLYNQGTTTIVFRNDLLYIRYLEGEPYGERHPHQSGSSWTSSFNNQSKQFMRKFAEDLKKSRLPALRRSIEKLQETAQ